MSKIFSIDDKKDLANRIQKIKRKNILKKIMKIIIKNNEKYLENNNGVYMFFHNLKNETYSELEICLKSIEKKIKNKSNLTNESPLSDTKYKPYIEKNNNILNQSNILRLSNTEKNLIKRKAYDKKIENNSKSTPLSDYIFSSKKKVTLINNFLSFIINLKN